MQQFVDGSARIMFSKDSKKKKKDRILALKIKYSDRDKINLEKNDAILKS